MAVLCRKVEEISSSVQGFNFLEGFDRVSGWEAGWSGFERVGEGVNIAVR